MLIKLMSKGALRSRGATALSYPPSPPRVRVRATVKLSVMFFHDESSISKGGGYESAIAPIQVEYPTDLYLSKILLQFEQSVINICTKIYNVDKNYKYL